MSGVLGGVPPLWAWLGQGGPGGQESAGFESLGHGWCLPLWGEGGGAACFFHGCKTELLLGPGTGARDFLGLTVHFCLSGSCECVRQTETEMDSGMEGRRGQKGAGSPGPLGVAGHQAAVAGRLSCSQRGLQQWMPGKKFHCL